MLEIYAPVLIVGVLASFFTTRFLSENFWNPYGLFGLCLGVCALLLVLIDSAFLHYSLLLYGFFVVFFVLALVDMEFLALPNAGLLVFLFISIMVGFFTPDMLVSMQITQITQGFAIMGILFVLKVFLESFWQKELFGEADIVVLGGIGMVFGVKFCVFSIFVASVFALIVAFGVKVIRRVVWRKIPFVSFLFLAVCAVFFGGAELLDECISVVGGVNV